jgi:hypothetical protein
MTDKPAKMTERVPGTQLDVFKGGANVALANALKRQGIAIDNIHVPDIVHHSKVTWEDLCFLATRDRKTFVSPIVVVTHIDARPDAPPEFPTYRGMVRVEFTTENGDTHFVTHAMAYAESGEYLPLWQWLKDQTPPHYARFGYIETRQSERHVVRAMPLDVETL